MNAESILAWFNPWRWLLMLGLVLALVAGGYALVDYIGDVREAAVNARWQAATDKLKADASAELAKQTDLTLKAERELGAARAVQETQDATNRQTVAGLERRLRAAAGPAGRLRDPNAAGCWASGGGTAGPAAAGPVDRPAGDSEAGGLLSAQLTGLLQRLEREADDINDAYASCRADSLKARAALP